MAKNNAQQGKPIKASDFFGRSNPVKAAPSQEKQVSFRLNAPDAFSVSVAGSFNQWTTGSFRLQREHTGIWKGTFAIKPGVYEYRFFVNGEWADDPSAKQTTANAFGTKNAVLEVK